METKKYYANQSMDYKVSFVAAIIFGIFAFFSLILLISPILMYRVMDGFLGDMIDDPFLFFLIFGLVTTILTILSVRSVRIESKPYLELFDDRMAVRNLNNGQVNIVNYKDIERIELCEIKVLGMLRKVVKIYPVPGVFEKTVIRLKKLERKRLENLHKNYGVIELVFSHFLDLPIEAVYEDIQQAMGDSRKNSAQ